MRKKLAAAVAVVAGVGVLLPATASADTAYVCYSPGHVAPWAAIEGSSPQLVRSTTVGTVIPNYPWTYAAGTTPAVAVLTSSLPATFAANPVWTGVKAGNYTLLCNILALFPSAKTTGGFINDNGQAIPTSGISVILFGSVPIPGYHEIWATS
jgi:hypothetical protein